jgi:hypothetical protein
MKGPISMVKKTIVVVLLLIGIIVASMVYLVLSAYFYHWYLPAPTGKYGIGLKALSVVDTSRIDPLSPSGSDKRELLLWIWYPASIDSGACPLAYIEKMPGVLKQCASMLSIPPQLFKPAESVITHTYPDARIAGENHAFPVLLFSHGIGLGTVGQNMVQFEELAGRGFVVVSIGHTYESSLAQFPDGRLIFADKERWRRLFTQELTFLAPLFRMNVVLTQRERDSLSLFYIQNTPILDSAHITWTADTRFVIDWLYKMRQVADTASIYSRIDLERLGIFGHSMGGMTAQKTAYDDPRVRAGISYDAPPVREALRDSMIIPFLFMNCEDFQSASEPAFSRSVPGTGYAWIKGTKHFNFCDFSLWTNTLFWKIIGFSGPIDGYRFEQILNDLTINFFDKHLNGENIDLSAIAAKYHEVQYREKTDAVKR